MVKKEIQKFKFIKKEGGLERALLTDVTYGSLGHQPMDLPSGRLAYLDYNYTIGVDTAVVDTMLQSQVIDTIQSLASQTVTFNSIERVLEFWDDSTSQLIKIPLDRLIS